MLDYFGNYNRVLEKLQKRFPEAFVDPNNSIMLKIEYRGISDIIHGLTQGKLFMGFGHDIDYWDSEDIKLSREAWAQFGRILYDADDNVKEMLEYLFPEFYAEALETLERIDRL